MYPKGSGEESTNGVEASPRFPQIEERVLAFWAQDDTFRASVERNAACVDGSNEFVFYDGPPFANGLPHYGHFLTGTSRTSSRATRRCAASRSTAASAGTVTASPSS